MWTREVRHLPSGVSQRSCEPSVRVQTQPWAFRTLTSARYGIGFTHHSLAYWTSQGKSACLAASLMWLSLSKQAVGSRCGVQTTYFHGNRCLGNG